MKDSPILSIIYYVRLKVKKMIEVYLKVRPKKRVSLSKQRGILAEFYNPNKVYILLFNLSAKNWKNFIKTFNALINHEITHYFLKGYRTSKRIQEKICRKMEFYQVQ